MNQTPGLLDDREPVFPIYKMIDFKKDELKKIDELGIKDPWRNRVPRDYLPGRLWIVPHIEYSSPAFDSYSQNARIYPEFLDEVNRNDVVYVPWCRENLEMLPDLISIFCF